MPRVNDLLLQMKGACIGHITKAEHTARAGTVPFQVTEHSASASGLPEAKQ